MNRTILHVDLNNFYASVEYLYNPDIRDKPVIVCGDAESRHGIALAKNQIAKKAGVKTGDVIWESKQKCPDLVQVPADFRKYLRFSRQARAIYADYTDQIESLGIDECWPDGRHWPIEKVLDVRMAASLKAGGQGVYLPIANKQVYLFCDDGKWFVEKEFFVLGTVP